MGPPSAVAAVIFDWGGTLTPWMDIDGLGLLRKVAAAALGKPADTDSAEVDRLAIALFEAEERQWALARTEHRSGTINATLQQAGVARTEAALDAWYREMEPYTFADPDAFDLLTELRRREIKVGILSNTGFPRDWHERIFARDGLLELIDGAVYTSEIPWVKPHREAFVAAMNAVGVSDPATVVFVGDRPFDDIHGAKAARMRAVLVPHSRIPDTQRGHTDGEPDAVIQRLADLIDVLDAWTGEPPARSG
ncbi:MAG: HAD family hydrolase [Sporichthyaceae bacterium]|nr:HAD family hydrolase [Sporichthyaceae bacterium]